MLAIVYNLDAAVLRAPGTPARDSSGAASL